MRIADYRITRFQFARDRVIGDSQVRIDTVNLSTVELIDERGQVGLGFVQGLFHPHPDQAEIQRVFEEEVWPDLDGQVPVALAHRVRRPRGGNQRAPGFPFEEAIQVALWDLAAKQAGLPLHRFLGSSRDRVPVYASGLDFHLDDAAFMEFFGIAADAGYRAFKIKVGHPDFERDLSRIDLLKRVTPRNSLMMIDANEAWSAKEASVKIGKIRDLGHDILWVEDPILRHDFEGLKMLRSATPWTMINSGEYLDIAGKHALLRAGATDMLNVHGPVTDVMRLGWLAAEIGTPVTLGNTVLEFGVHVACALPEVDWLEYSFQNFEHLVEEPMRIENGWIFAPDRPGHGLVLSEEARRDWMRPDVLHRADLGEAPPHSRGRAAAPKARERV
ncbi:mandelate racemase/muconate lactonizing enzyme family protein [Tropicibacter sp. S64]|uniref:mandelate racemase/muconate lactonizing enzyme family protein n=1 Tax=Tropicibacter sp. S64 TaxID=3415122 RepID=UPI003C7B02B5